MSACDMGGLCCKSSPCTYLRPSDDCEDVEALKAELAEWRTIPAAMGLHPDQPASVVMHNAIALRQERDQLKAALQIARAGLVAGTQAIQLSQHVPSMAALATDLQKATVTVEAAIGARPADVEPGEQA